MRSAVVVLVMIYFQLCHINLSQRQINSHIIHDREKANNTVSLKSDALSEANGLVVVIGSRLSIMFRIGFFHLR